MVNVKIISSLLSFVDFKVSSMQHCFVQRFVDSVAKGCFIGQFDKIGGPICFSKKSVSFHMEITQIMTSHFKIAYFVAYSNKKRQNVLCTLIFSYFALRTHCL